MKILHPSTIQKFTICDPFRLEREILETTDDADTRGDDGGKTGSADEQHGQDSDDENKDDITWNSQSESYLAETGS